MTHTNMSSGIPWLYNYPSDIIAYTRPLYFLVALFLFVLFLFAIIKVKNTLHGSEKPTNKMTEPRDRQMEGLKLPPHSLEAE
ncbi:hypothetical protein DBO95_26890, partial [Yersinia pestis]